MKGASDKQRILAYLETQTSIHAAKAAASQRPVAGRRGVTLASQARLLRDVFGVQREILVMPFAAGEPKTVVVGSCTMSGTPDGSVLKGSAAHIPAPDHLSHSDPFCDPTCLTVTNKPCLSNRQVQNSRVETSDDGAGSGSDPSSTSCRMCATVQQWNFAVVNPVPTGADQGAAAPGVMQDTSSQVSAVSQTVS